MRLKWIKSTIGYKENQEKTIAALGFKRLNQVLEKETNPAMLGMVEKVRHLLQVEVIDD